MVCYRNTLCGDSFQNVTNGPWNNVKIPKASGTALSRAVTVANYLVENGGLTKVQAAAVVGVYIDENGCNPGTYNKAEKAGKGAKGTSGFGYGAGIASWTFTDFKNKALTQVGFPQFTPIETLSLEDQAKMVVGNINGNASYYYNALKRCASIEDASATAVVITGGVGFVNKNAWLSHPVASDGQHVSDVYCKANNKRFGYSEHHCNLYARRLDYAKQVLAAMENSSNSGNSSGGNSGDSGNGGGNSGGYSGGTWSGGGYGGRWVGGSYQGIWSGGNSGNTWGGGGSGGRW